MRCFLLFPHQKGTPYRNAILSAVRPASSNIRRNRLIITQSALMAPSDVQDTANHFDPLCTEGYTHTMTLNWPEKPPKIPISCNLKQTEGPGYLNPSNTSPHVNSNSRTWAMVTTIKAAHVFLNQTNEATGDFYWDPTFRPSIQRELTEGCIVAFDVPGSQACFLLLLLLTFII